jgi:hypothetical protein
LLTSSKILNALNLPRPTGRGIEPIFFSTDSAAWDSTNGISSNYPNAHPPYNDIRWGLAATAGAISWWHIDSNGFATYLDCKCGKKFIIMGRRKEESFESFSEIDIFLNDFKLDEPNTDRWDLEAVVLPPRTRL